MASKSAARRRAASAKAGTYQRSKIGIASAKARARLRVRVGKSDTYHNQRIFHSLDRAVEFAASLPESQQSYIIGTGEYNNASQYKGKSKGGAALSSWARANYYKAYPDDIKDENERIFKEGKATSYYVRWKDI